MDPRFAVVMDNYFPDGTRVRLRNGCENHATGFTAPVETVHAPAFGNSTRLVAFSGPSVYDVTGGGAIGAPLATGFTNSQWFGVNAGPKGGERALYTNGVDAAQSWDGTTWAAAGFTGPTKPIGAHVAHKRFWTIENGTGEVWYSPLEAVTGALTKFDIGSVHPEGGELIAVNSVTVDGGEGPDDLTAFLMRSGALILYAGTDPADSANWSLRGVYKTGNPIGRNCLVPYDDDLIVITDTGFQSVLGFTAPGRLSGVTISDNISLAVSDASQDYEQNFGWCGIYNPHDRQLIFNIPRTTNLVTDQYVMNTVSSVRPWGRFKGWNAICFATRENRLYFGTNNTVKRGNAGGIDVNQPIVGRVQTAWNYFELPGISKGFTQFRPHIRSNSAISLGLGLGTDFKDPVIRDVGITTSQVAGQWNTAIWNQSTWATGTISSNDWRGAGNSGYNASVAYETSTRGVVVELLATDIQFEIEQ